MITFAEIASVYEVVSVGSLVQLSIYGFPTPVLGDFCVMCTYGRSLHFAPNKKPLLRHANL